MNSLETKADRLGQIQMILLDHPGGLTIRALAEKLEVNSSTVWRYCDSGSLARKAILYEDGLLKLDRKAFRINVGLSLHEAMALHLATRLLATRMDRRNPHAASALRKLSQALETAARPVSRMMQRSADEMESQDQWSDPKTVQILETLTEALASGRKVRVLHPSEKSGKLHEYILAPYVIEPYAIGQSTHVIGPIDPEGKLWTLKIERIQSAELLPDLYSIPPEFDPAGLLKDAWGIWFTEKEPVQVALRFSPAVARRVVESRWHRSQETRLLEDGSLLWQARVAEPREMTNWIHGWGAEVEVLEPPELRSQFAEEAARLAGLYAE